MTANETLVVHPVQVGLANQVVTPSETELAWARQVLEAWERRVGHAVLSVDGRMIDRPAIIAAQRRLARSLKSSAR